MVESLLMRYVRDSICNETLIVSAPAPRTSSTALEVLEAPDQELRRIARTDDLLLIMFRSAGK